MGDKTIPDAAEPRLESFYPPFVAGVDLPHQGVVSSYNQHLCGNTVLIFNIFINIYVWIKFNKVSGKRKKFT